MLRLIIDANNISYNFIIYMETLWFNFSQLGYLIGYFFEVDLDYPDEFYDLHNDYSLVGEKIHVRKEMLSSYQLHIVWYNNFSLGKSKKLILNLGNKTKYKLQNQNFKVYLTLGLQLKKII